MTIALDDTPLPTTRRRVSPVEPFESVLEHHGPAVPRFCVARPAPDRGEEALQETLLAALRHYDDLHDRGAAGRWLFSIAQRKIGDVTRRAPRQPSTPARSATN
ncbi:MAG: RNA polymerase sigma factor [Solirubrobacteraceae bacterium]